MKILKLTPDIAKKVEIALVTYTYEQMRISVVAALLCITVILIAFYSSDKHVILFTWYTVSLAIMLGRTILSEIYKLQKNPEAHAILWRNLFILGTLLGGLSWGFIGAFLFPNADNFQKILCILVLAGITAGAVQSLSAMLSAVILFLIIAITPFIIQISRLDVFTYLLYDVTLTVYLICMIMLSVRVHRMIKSGISLRFEKDALLKDLALANKKLEDLATHDSLTHADNSRLFYINLANAIKRAERNRKLLGLFFIDLDQFKEVNDTYGHDIGDQVLLTVTERLRKTLRATDLIARLGGDEFTIILENITDQDSVSKIARQVCQAIAMPIKFEKFEINISVSIGISIYPNDGHDEITLLKAADDAMYYAKQHGRNNFHFSSNFSVR